MNIISAILSSVLVVVFAASAVSYAEKAENQPTAEKKNEAEEPIGVGPDKGVLEATKDKGFKLSDKATKGLEVKTGRVTLAGSSFSIPRQALLSFQDESGFYRFRDGFYKLVELKPADVKNDSSGKLVIVNTKDLVAEDEVAVNGAELLRLTDLNIWGGEEGGE